MKHELNRLGPDGFERLIQALMSRLFGIQVKIYGDGPDRQREAVIDNAHYRINGEFEVLGRTIVQAKYKSPDGKEADWPWLRNNLKKELDGFKEVAQKDSAFLPDTWVFFTNVVLTPAKGGLKDQADDFVKAYAYLIPNIDILGSDDVRALLDVNPDVARRYAAFLTSSDVLQNALDYLDELQLNPFRSLLEYVTQRFRADEPVRLEQAGSVAEGSIAIQNVYIDLEAEGEFVGQEQIDGLAASIIHLGDRPHPRVVYEQTPRHGAPANNIVLLGNAGQGKSTLCQYVCQLYRASILKRFCPSVRIPDGYTEHAEIANPKCERFPFLIRLKEFAAWIRKMQDDGRNCSVLSYLTVLIEREGNTSIEISRMRDLLQSYSWVFVFDGLDEVPASSNRAEVLKQIDSFLSQDLTQATCDSLVICTSRPQGYDGAFSPSRYRHFELQEMSPERCLCYIDKLLKYIERSADYRKKYRKTLERALDDPLIAKLMTTPLYTAILVLLVKSGKTPPTRRYELFNEYCEIVLQRELQKGLLPSLYDGNYDWVKETHALIAYLLQSESESADNAAAELSTKRCHNLIRVYLEHEEWKGNRAKKATELYQAMTNRLPFLAETTDANGGSCVLFPLRSIQEYFAAECLLKIEESEKRCDMLESLSLSAYWRNVFLFVAGRYSRDNSRSVNNTIYAICEANNGDPNFAYCEDDACRNDACTIALPGSFLALDLLRDNLFERKGGQRRYLDLAARLLSWNISEVPSPAFMALPPSLREPFVRERAIPYFRESKNPNEAVFGLLFEEAKKGNYDAKNVLEELADSLSLPTSRTVVEISWRLDVHNMGMRLLHRVHEWVFATYPEVAFSSELLSSLNAYRRIGQTGLLPNVARRWLAYALLIGFPSWLTERLDDLLSKDSLLANMLTLSQGFGSVRLLVRHDKPDWTMYGFASTHRLWPDHATPWAELVDLFKQNCFHELEALAAFYCEPCARNLAKLLDACSHLPKPLREFYCHVLQSQYMLFCILFNDLEKHLDVDVGGVDFYDYCNEKYYEGICEREERTIAALQANDYGELNRLNAWPYLHYVRIDNSDIQSWVPHEIREASEPNCQCILSAFPPHYFPINMTDELHDALLHRFPVAFRSPSGVQLALSAFLRESMEQLVNNKLVYPNDLPLATFMDFGDEAMASAVLSRIRKLSELGDAFCNVYSLVPYVFCTADRDTLRRMAEGCYARLGAIQASGNGCALLGVTLLLLAGDDPMDRETALAMRLDCLMKKTGPSVWAGYSRQFSLSGRLLVHEIGADVYRGTKHEEPHLAHSRCAILQGLEAIHVDQNKLPVPGDPGIF